MHIVVMNINIFLPFCFYVIDLKMYKQIPKTRSKLEVTRDLGKEGMRGH